MDSAMEFLLNRRSRPAKLLTGPGPSRAEMEAILRAGARVPDHGKLEPWRFVVLEEVALARVAGQVRARAATIGEDPDKAALPFEGAPLAVAVVAVPRESDKIPEIEQTLSSACVALSVLNAALASGWGANWLTGWVARDPVLAGGTFGLVEGEWIVGFVHIGTCNVEVPDRPRPDVGAITTWIEA
jgi:nitroreductase